MAEKRTILLFGVLVLGIAITARAQQAGFGPSRSQNVPSGTGREVKSPIQSSDHARPAVPGEIGLPNSPGTMVPRQLPMQQTDRAFQPDSRRPEVATDRTFDNSISTLAHQSASITIQILGPPKVQAGAPVLYDLIVRNQGSGVAEGVTVQAALPAGSELVSADLPPRPSAGALSWDLGNMEPGSKRRIRLQLRSNGESELHFGATVSCKARCGVRTVVDPQQLRIVITAPPTVALGEAVRLMLKISNPGNVGANNVVVRTELPDGMEHPAGNDIEYEIGTLPAGQSREVPLTLTTRTPGRKLHRVDVTADGALKSTAHGVVQVLESQLVLENTGPKRRYVNRPATYSIVVRNPGNSPAKEVVIEEQLPDGMVLLTATGGGEMAPGQHRVRWAIGDLLAGESRGVSVTVRCDKPGELSSQAIATAEGKVQARAAVNTLVEGIAALMFEVVDLHDPVEAGSEIGYEIRIVNQGTQAATNLVISAVAPQGTHPLKADGPVPSRTEGQQIIFEPLPRLGPRADAGYFVHLRGDRPGDLRFRVKLECDQLESPVNSEESTRVYSD